MFGQGFNSPQLHHATEVGSSAGFRSFLRGDAVGSAPLLLAFVKQTGCTLARHDTPVSWRPPTWALAVRQLPSAPPTLRADARAARYESISPYPIGARYSVLASLVLTAQSDPKNREYGTSATPFFFGSPPASLSAPFR